MLRSFLFTLITSFVIVLAHAGNIHHNDKHSMTHFFELNITREFHDPDCSGYTGPKLLINGQMPGPPIQVTKGDHVRMLVRNMLPAKSIKFTKSSAMGGSSNEITIHVHGIRQFGSPESDGVPYLTQDPIQAGESYLYEFQVIDQAGTYFYHAHVGLVSESVFGEFVVYESEKARPDAYLSNQNHLHHHGHGLIAGPYHYDDERTILLSEWWHETAEELGTYLLGPSFAGIPAPSSILINGRTIYQPNNVTQTKEKDYCQGYSVIEVDPIKRYRLRVIGGNIYETISFAINDHPLTVIEVDGTLVKPYTVPYLEVSPGQRFSVLLEPCSDEHQKEKEYAINTIRDWLNPQDNPSSNGLAVLRYTTHQNKISNINEDQNNIINKKEQEVTTFYVPENRFKFPGQSKLYWYWNNLEPVDDYNNKILEQEASRTIVLEATAARLPSKEVRWFINNVTFVDPNKTILTEPDRPLPDYSKLTKNGYDPELGTYPLKYNEVVDIVLQSTRPANQACNIHPWHTHGHSFYEIAYGDGLYNEEKDGSLRNVPHPFLRDVVPVYPSPELDLEVASLASNDSIYCGWSKIRLIADNPGIWAMHCHNTPHMIMGMMIALEEAPEELKKLKHY